MSPGTTLMLVEDEAIIALGEKMTLEKAGYSVVLASSGEQAVERIRANGDAIALVLMDIDLGPGIDGTQAASEILQDRDLPVVFLSSHTEKEYTDRADRISSYGYVVKQSGDTVLLTSIKMAFRLFETKRALRESNQRLAAYLQMSQAVTAATDLGSLVELIVKSIAEITPAKHNTVYLRHGHDRIRRLAVVESGHEDSSERYEYASLDDHPHVAKAIETGRPVIVTETLAEDWTPEEREIVEMLRLRTIVYVPIRAEAGTVGVLIIGVPEKPCVFTDEEVSLLRGFATEVGRLIAKVRALDESQATVERLEPRRSDETT